MILVTVSVVLCFPQSSHPQVFRPDPSLGYTTYQHESGDWGGIYYKERSGTDRFVLQIYNLKYCSMDILLFGIRSMGNWDGLYNSNNVNPYFYKMDHDSAYALYKYMYSEKVLSLTNGAFFEAPAETSYTKLAYPLQYGGIVMSSGGSPYGPIGGRYPLKVLQISDSSVEIQGYDYENCLAMRNATFPNQIVTLNYLSHPNVKDYPQLVGGYENRYHLLTALDCDNESGNETIVILSSNFEMSICELAREMKRLHPSIKDENILTLDGGSSISIQDRNGKTIIEPGTGVKVPMYIGFRLREERGSNAPKLMNPKKNEVVNSNRPYYIFYFSKDETNDFELYQNGILLSKLDDSGLASHKGLFVWNPTSCKPGANYQVKIRSSTGLETYSECFIVGKEN